MMTFREGNLEFEFSDNNWNVLKLDEHRDYRGGIEKLDETKAIDFLGILDDRALYLIEVKDFHGHRIETKTRLLKGELPIEVGQKVRDSLACIIGASRTSSEPELWTPFARLLINQHQVVKVVLWLEHNLPTYPPGRRKVRASVESNVFKKKLKWLTSQVLVFNLSANILPGVQVRRLPRP